MREARQTLQDNMGRLVSYIPLQGSNDPRVDDLTVRWTSAEDVFVLTDRGEERKRSVVLNVPIGSGTGQLPRVLLDSTFLIDVDGTGAPVEWTAYAFLNADGLAGFKRVQCVREILKDGIIGHDRPGVR